jgi:hypothetical protein
MSRGRNSDLVEPMDLANMRQNGCSNGFWITRLRVARSFDLGLSLARFHPGSLCHIGSL